MAEVRKSEEIILYSRTPYLNQAASQGDDLLDEDIIVKCIEFDQDCFYDARMILADENQAEWTTTILPEIEEVPRDQYTRALTDDWNKGDAFFDKNLIKRIEEMRQVEHRIMAAINVQNIILLGSTQDGLYLEKGVPLFDTKNSGMNYSDIDILFEYGGIEIKQSLQENAELPYLLLEHTKNSGYFKLRICPPSSEPGSMPLYFRNSYLKIKLYGDLDCTRFYAIKNSLNENSNLASIVGNSENEFGINEIDNVAAFKMSAWPKFANAFKTRQRASGWPPPELVEKVVCEGCGFVPKGHSASVEKEYEWRVSFAVSEKILVRSLSTTQIRAYLFFKTIVKLLLNEPEGLSSYMMKNVFFWTMETVEENLWQEDNVLSCVEALVDMLCACLDKRLIVSFFLPSLNLVSHLEPAVLRKLSEKALAIQKNIFKAIVMCSRSSEFKGTCHVALSLLGIKASTREVDIPVQCSMAYFTMYLFLRLQRLRYQIRLNLRVLKKSFDTSCRSITSAVPPRAVWYLLESIKLLPDSVKVRLHRDENGQYILDVEQLRKSVVGFWRSTLYTGMFRKMITDQEFVTNDDVVVIPDFRRFVDWVDLSLVWDGGEHIDVNYIHIGVGLD